MQLDRESLLVSMSLVLDGVHLKNNVKELENLRENVFFLKILHSLSILNY